jgi:hypothetical protein
MPARLRSQRGGWLRGAAATALVAGASACTFLTAPGSPLPAAFEDASTWSAATLSARSKGQCKFLLNDPYVEAFAGATLNASFWDPTQNAGAQHCSGLAPAGPAVCTMAATSQMQTGSELPGPYTTGTDKRVQAGDKGLTATISQEACVKDSAACKFNGGESFWLGAHAESMGCIQFGVLEITTRMVIPPAVGAFFFLATCALLMLELNQKRVLTCRKTQTWKEGQ